MDLPQEERNRTEAKQLTCCAAAAAETTAKACGKLQLRHNYPLPLPPPKPPAARGNGQTFGAARLEVGFTVTVTHGRLSNERHHELAGIKWGWSKINAQRFRFGALSTETR